MFDHLDPWLAQAAPDILSLAFSLLLVGGYQLFLHLQVKRNSAYTNQAMNNLVRRVWVRHIMHSVGNGVLAVQTLRNSVMAATFLASTAILLIIGILTLSEVVPHLEPIHDAPPLVQSPQDTLWLIKLLMLLLTFLVAFFSFSLAIRAFNHVGYMINVPITEHGDVISTWRTSRMLNSGGQWYSIGLRAYFFAVPQVFWLFGPYLLMAASIVLIVVLYHLDRAPTSGA